MLKNKLEIITLKKQVITNFADERNILMSKSNSEWVLFVDTDETVTSELKKEIENVINSTKKQAFFIFRKNYFLGQYVGRDKILRLIKTESGKWTRAVHEKFILNNKSNTTGVIKNPLIHNTANNLKDYMKKINYYSKLHWSENIKEGKSSNLFKIIFYPVGKFIITLFKSRNIVFSIMQSLHSFLSWSQIWLYQRN